MGLKDFYIKSTIHAGQVVELAALRISKGWARPELFDGFEISLS